MNAVAGRVAHFIQCRHCRCGEGRGPWRPRNERDRVRITAGDKAGFVRQDLAMQTQEQNRRRSGSFPQPAVPEGGWEDELDQKL